MPWWGWLTAFCVAAICLTVMGVVTMTTSTMHTLGRRVGKRRSHDPLWKTRP